MEDLIKRLRRAAKESFFLKDLLSEAADALQDVQPVKHEYWKYETDYCLVCSGCGNPAEINGISGEFIESPYCNECGARMDGET